LVKIGGVKGRQILETSPGFFPESVLPF